MPEDTLLLSQSDVAQCTDMEAVIDSVKRVFQAHGEDQVVMPSKITLDIRPKGHEFWSNAMPAFVGPFGAAGIKWAGGFVSNPPKHKLPYVMATILLQDPDTGWLKAVMDGGHITNLRTGAAAAVSAYYSKTAGASKVAIVGAGTQGRTSLWALSHLMQITEVRAVDAFGGMAERYAKEMGDQLGLGIRACHTVQEAVEDADIVITATPANEPLVKNAWLKPGVTAISLGSFQEFDDEFVLKADRVIVDSWEQCSHRGELARLVEGGKMGRANVAGELGDVAVGRVPGRSSETERVLVVPIGLGSHDLAIAATVYQKAIEKGLGGRFRFM